MPLTLNATGVAVVDDTDPNIIYQGTWKTSGVSQEFNSTTHGAVTSGSTATFLFNGTSVAVYGTLGKEGVPNSTYNLDDSSLVVFSAPQVNSAVHQTLFYQSPSLLDGHHRLTITFLNGNGVYWLDYFLFLPSTNQPMSAVTSTSSMTYNTNAPAASHSSAGAHNSNAGAIAGGTIGGLILFATIIALLYSLRRQAIKIQSLEGGSRPSRGIDPFLVSQPPHLDNRPSPLASNTVHSSATTHDPAYLSQPLSRPTGELPATSASFNAKHSSEYPVYAGQHNRTTHSLSGSRSDNPSNPDASQSPSVNTMTRYPAVSTEFSPITYPTDSLYISPQSSPLVANAGFWSHNIQSDNSDVRVHQDGRVRIAGGSSEMERSYTPSRDIPPAYGRY